MIHCTLYCTKAQIASSTIDKTPKKHITVRFANTNKQAGENDCGVFATTYCAALAHGENPSTFVYDQKVTRNHLVRCLEDGAIQPFPVIRQKRIGVPNTITIDVFCCCRNTDDGTKMVLCNKCKEWYHLSCISSTVKKGKKLHFSNCQKSL